MSNMFLRNMLTDLGNRSEIATPSEKFTPYFQYKIGKYLPDYYLYFPKEPLVNRYKNEIFNKLQQYSGYDLIQYLEFHYTLYPDKTDFLRFLHYEISERLIKRINKSLKQKMEHCLQWVREKQSELHSQQPAEVNGNGTITSQGKYLPEYEEASHKTIEDVAQVISQKITGYMDKVLAGTEERLETMTSSYVTGHIELNNHHHLGKVIQLFYLLQTIQAPPKIARGEQMFKKFSATDLASILHLHFEAFRDKKINTLQVKIREANERLNPNNPKVQKLVAALQDFFY